MILKKEQGEGFDYKKAFKTVNFYKVGETFVRTYFRRMLEKHIEEKDVHSYYELIIQEALSSGHLFYGLRTSPYKWWEIDTQEDLDYAVRLFLG
jgi:choline kinase